MTQSALQTFMEDLSAYGVTDLVGEDLFVTVADQFSQVQESEVSVKPAKKIVKESDVFATPDLPFGQGGAPVVSVVQKTPEPVARPRTEIKSAATSAKEVEAQLAQIKENLKSNKPVQKVTQEIDERLLEQSIAFFEGEGAVVCIDLPDTNFPKGKTLTEPEQLKLLNNIALASGWDLSAAYVVFVARQKADGGFYSLDEETYLAQYVQNKLADVNISQIYAFGQQSLKLVAKVDEISSARSTEAIETERAVIAPLPALLSMLKQPHLKKNAWLKILSMKAKSSNISSLQNLN